MKFLFSHPHFQVFTRLSRLPLGHYGHGQRCPADKNKLRYKIMIKIISILPIHL